MRAGDRSVRGMTAGADRGLQEGEEAAGVVIGAEDQRGGVSGERNGLEAAKNTADLPWAKATWIRRCTACACSLQSIPDCIPHGRINIRLVCGNLQPV